MCSTVQEHPTADGGGAKGDAGDLAEAVPRSVRWPAEAVPRCSWWPGEAVH